MKKESILDQNLNFSDAPDYISKPPSYTATEMIALCEKMLPYWNEIRKKNPPPPFVGEAFSLLQITR